MGNIEDKKYKKICDKLGFIPQEYLGEISDTEDDREDNPFRKLTEEELIYLYDNGYLNNKN